MAVYTVWQKVGVAIMGVIMSTCLSNTLKYIFSVQKFHFPLIITAVHMAVSFLVARVAIFKYGLATNYREFTLREQFDKILPICVCHVLSVGCNNLALLSIFPSFVAMMSNTLPLFTLGFGVILGTEGFNKCTLAAVCLILAGSFLSAKKEINFTLAGFSLLIFSIIFRALKQVLQARCLRTAEDKVDSITLLYYVSPMSFYAFLIWSFFYEGVEPFIALQELPINAILLILLSTVLACGFNLVAFLGVQILNATTWSLLGQVNAPLVAVISHVIFRNEISIAQIGSFITSMIGVFLYQNYGKVKNEFKIIQNEELTPVKQGKFDSGVAGPQFAKEVSGFSELQDEEILDWGQDLEESVEPFDKHYSEGSNSTIGKLRG